MLLLAVPLVLVVMVPVAVRARLPVGSPEAAGAAAEPGDREDARHRGHQEQHQGDTNAILGGWQLNSIYNMRTGIPVNVVRGNNPSSVLPGLRPDLIADPVIPRDQRTLLRYFNTDAFTSAPFDCSTPTSVTCNAPGDAGRNILRGPGYINLDASLFKIFSFTERFRLELRLELFNALNTPHFANPNGDEGTMSNFGEITQTFGNQRIAQIAGKFYF